MKAYNTIFLTLLISLITACNSNNFKIHSSGLEYNFIIENKGNVKPVLGDIIVLKMSYTDDVGNIIEESAYFKTKLKKSSHDGGSIEDAISLMHKGDSAIFKINTADFYQYSKKQRLPQNLLNTNKLTFHLKLIDILDKEEYEKEQELAKLSNKRYEKTSLNKYLEQNSITTEPNMSGLYFIELKSGTGNSPIPGKKVTVHYNGFFLNGELFNSSYELNEPFEFHFGIGKVIQGWDEGIAQMKVGGKYKLIIPSYLAYGDQQVGPIPPNSTLIFEIELINCEQ